MSKGLKTALKQLRQAAENLSRESEDHAEYPKERDKELLRRAKFVAFRLANALESGPSYHLASLAQEFDHILNMES